MRWETNAIAKTQWNNPWLLPPFRFDGFCQGLFLWVLGFCHWLTSLSAVCDFPFRFLIASVNNIFTSSLLLHFLCTLLYMNGSLESGSLAFWGRLTCTLVSPLLNCPGSFVWCLPLCDYNITQVFQFCKMAVSTKYASCICWTCRKRNF